MIERLTGLPSVTDDNSDNSDVQVPPLLSQLSQLSSVIEGRSVLALDLGTVTGWAVQSAGGLITSGTVDFKPRRFEGGGMRYLRFKKTLDDLHVASGGFQRIVFEEVRRHMGVDAAHVYGGLMATLTAWAELHAIPYQGVPVSTWKEALTGKGNASKDDVIQIVRGRGFDPRDDNEADAIGILSWAIAEGAC